MIVKRKKDHKVKQSPYCGELQEILSGSEYSPNIAIALDICPTKAHYHSGFDEIYFVIDGYLVLKLFTPELGEITEQGLSANELCVIPKGIHHKVSEASVSNRLCIITMPCFADDDEHLSDVF